MVRTSEVDEEDMSSWFGSQSKPVVGSFFFFPKPTSASGFSS